MIPTSCTSAPRTFRLAVLAAAFAAAAAAGGCGSEPANRDARVTDSVSFQLERPAARHVLEDDLTELSGLAALDAGRLAAVQDELGVLFVVDVSTGRIRARRPFAAGGDYEALVRDGDTLRVLRSDGRLFATPLDAPGAAATTERTLALPAGCDAEGLSVEAGTLLVACKEDVTMPDRAGVYVLERGKNAPPAPRGLDWRAALDVLANPERDRERLARRFRSLFSGPQTGFRPSDVAIDPETGDVWVLSAVPPAVAVFRADGTLREARTLPRARFPQPEALTFLPDGTLVVGSEGRGAAAPLYVFRRRNPPP